MSATVIHYMHVPFLSQTPTINGITHITLIYLSSNISTTLSLQSKGTLHTKLCFRYRILHRTVLRQFRARTILLGNKNSHILLFCGLFCSLPFNLFLINFFPQLTVFVRIFLFACKQITIIRFNFYLRSLF